MRWRLTLLAWSAALTLAATGCATDEAVQAACPEVTPIEDGVRIDGGCEDSQGVTWLGVREETGGYEAGAALISYDGWGFEDGGGAFTVDGVAYYEAQGDTLVLTADSLTVTVAGEPACDAPACGRLRALAGE